VVDSYLQFVRDNHYGPEISAHDGDIGWPMLQAFHSVHTHRIYSLAGFRDLSGKPPLMRAATKLICVKSNNPSQRKDSLRIPQT
jgi:hypothetical protein